MKTELAKKEELILKLSDKIDHWGNILQDIQRGQASIKAADVSQFCSSVPTGSQHHYLLFSLCPDLKVWSLDTRSGFRNIYKGGAIISKTKTCNLSTENPVRSWRAPCQRLPLILSWLCYSLLNKFVNCCLCVLVLKSQIRDEENYLGVCKEGGGHYAPLGCSSIPTIEYMQCNFSPCLLISWPRLVFLDWLSCGRTIPELSCVQQNACD